MTAVSSPSRVEVPSVKPLPLDAYLRMTLVLRVGLGMALAILGGGIVVYTLENPNVSSSSVLTSNPILSYLSLEGLGSGLASGAVGAFLTLGLLGTGRHADRPRAIGIVTISVEPRANDDRDYFRRVRPPHRRLAGDRALRPLTHPPGARTASTGTSEFVDRFADRRHPDVGERSSLFGVLRLGEDPGRGAGTRGPKQDPPARAVGLDPVDRDHLVAVLREVLDETRQDLLPKVDGQPIFSFTSE